MPTTSVRSARSGHSERPISKRGSAFRAVWSQKVPEDRTGKTLVLPDGAVDIVWLAGELVVAGPDPVAKHEQTEPGSTVAGIRFARGAASAWLGLDMRELVGLRVPLGDVIGSRRAMILAERLRTREDRPSLVSAMESAFFGMADPAAAHFATKLIGACEAAVGEEAVVSSAVRATGLSERTLRRHCDRTFGYGPRTLSRILRLQRLLALLRTEPDLTLAIAAAASGFADQPHMNREVRSLTSMSPVPLFHELAVEAAGSDRMGAGLKSNRGFHGQSDGGHDLGRSLRLERDARSVQANKPIGE